MPTVVALHQGCTNEGSLLSEQASKLQSLEYSGGLPLEISAPARS